MKKLMKGVLEWKTGVCLAFTASMLIYVVIALLMGEKQIEATSIFAMLTLCMVGSFVQYLCFTDNIIKNMRYTRRLLLFGVLFLPLLTVIAVVFGWFPAYKPGAWLLFLGLALVVLAAMTLGFELYFRVAGRKYDGLLGQYRKQHEADDASGEHARRA